MIQDSNIIIGTRGSDLALWQAHHLQDELKKQGIGSELKIIKTKGDKIQHLGFDKMEGKGFFTKEIEEALLNEEVDIAVHSLKDLPTDKVPGLVISGLSYREDPADVLIIPKERLQNTRLLSLPENAIVGSSSIRRKAQITSLVPDVVVKDLRGNVPTRIQKLRDGAYDAIIIAAAGLKRLDLEYDELHIQRLNPREFVPAPGQGIIAYQTRTEDLRIRKSLQAVHQRDVAKRSNVERKVLNLMDGGCHIPLGVYCELDPKGHYHCFAAYARDGYQALKRTRISQSTSYGLAESIVEALKSD
jgi:hydroxymethylbilane synthase